MGAWIAFAFLALVALLVGGFYVKVCYDVDEIVRSAYEDKPRD